MEDLMTTAEGILYPTDGSYLNDLFNPAEDRFVGLHEIYRRRAEREGRKLELTKHLRVTTEYLDAA